MSLDILNDTTPIDLSTVRTAMPVLKPSLHAGVLAAFQVEPNKKGTGSNASIELTLVNGAEDVGGKTVNPGFKVFDLISCVKTFKEDGTTVSYDPMQKLVALYEALGGSKDQRMTAGELVRALQSCVGQPVNFRTRVEDDPTYGQKTRVDRYVKP